MNNFNIKSNKDQDLLIRQRLGLLPTCAVPSVSSQGLLRGALSSNVTPLERLFHHEAPSSTSTSINPAIAGSKKCTKNVEDEDDDYTFCDDYSQDRFEPYNDATSWGKLDLSLITKMLRRDLDYKHSDHTEESKYNEYSEGRFEPFTSATSWGALDLAAVQMRLKNEYKGMKRHR